jgi:hypothetical protein
MAKSVVTYLARRIRNAAVCRYKGTTKLIEIGALERAACEFQISTPTFTQRRAGKSAAPFASEGDEVGVVHRFGGKF